MTAPALAHTTDLGRMYARSLSEPPKVPSITTVIGQQAASLDGWIGYMAANAVARHPDLGDAVGNPGRLRTVVRDSSNAAEQYRDAAASRGDRVHHYCEQVALRALGRPHQMPEARAALADKGEENFAVRFDAWWDEYKVQPLAPEITVWNETLGYAGTLDLVATIGGKLCIIDYKTKGTDRNGQVKGLDAKVVMQLVAGMKAEESIVDESAGTWEAWKYGTDPVLLGVAIGETEVRTLRANPAVLKQHWFKFASLRRVWQTSLEAAQAGAPLLPIAAPAG
ncbi:MULTISPECIES: cytochrome [unclassified Arthrobacter]|uniref:cytochrome n=1 Tax=unclassified Arthrobacter TaxID=235627 RepID=UPI00159E9BF8|nr:MULTISPECIES: cytochrome [unclassified Arthrobacter]MCQ9164045.1 cytochrome [Arthrobacter sp. STN4]NVM97792.1 cytochrome [Arthrobacter sp. SDTb3-6]